jgi:hypothetical protein
LKLFIGILRDPPHLGLQVLPVNARREVKYELKRYLAREAWEENKVEVENVLRYLENLEEKQDLELMRKFITFTKELDRDRSQDFAQLSPRLIQHFSDCGLEWRSRSPRISDRWSAKMGDILSAIFKGGPS